MSLASDELSALALLDLTDEEDLEDDEFGDATLIADSDDIDGPGEYELKPVSDAPGNSGDAPGNSGDAPGNSGDAPGNGGDAPRGAQDDTTDEEQGEDTSE